VPFSHATRSHAALDAAGVPNQLVPIRGGKHGGYNRQEVLNGYAAIKMFPARHNISKVK
jgi:hypothetical protein